MLDNKWNDLGMKEVFNASRRVVDRVITRMKSKDFLE